MKQPAPESSPRTAAKKHAGTLPAERATPRDAGILLRVGLWLLLTGMAAVVLMENAFGGIHRHGPHTNGGWLLLVVVLTCLPLGIMASALGGAKWLGNRRRYNSGR